MRARSRTGRILLSLLTAAVASLALAASASAWVLVNEDNYLTTADICTIDLTPATADRQTGTLHTVVATVSSTGLFTDSVRAAGTATWENVRDACLDNGDISELAGVDVQFTVTSGPNAGINGVGTLDSSGQATFSYTGLIDGTDTIEAAITLPDICELTYNDPVGDPDPTTTACDYLTAEAPVLTGLPTTQGYACSQSPGPFEQQCPTVTLTDTASVTWSTPPAAPAPQVVAQADPTVSIASLKRCVSHKFRVRPSYANGTVQSSTLFVDSRKIATRNGDGSFIVNGKKYKAGKHNIEVVTVFTNGKAASKFGSFSRCKVRTAARKISPQFTG